MTGYATDIAQLLSTFMPEPAEKSQQCFYLAFLANPEQSFTTRIDLINQCQVAMSALSLDFINTDGCGYRISPDGFDPSSQTVRLNRKHGPRSYERLPPLPFN